MAPPPPSPLPPQHSNSTFHLDALYCQEDHCWEEEEEEQQQQQDSSDNGSSSLSFLPFLLNEEDLYWENDELITLFSKETELINPYQSLIKKLKSHDHPNLLIARRDSIEWMLRVNTHYGFSSLTSILSVNFFDRFISNVHHFHKDKPWMTQLVSVACVSLAAKVEETQVPLLLDLQIEETKYVFEAKTIQKMELLILSSLDWKMNPVTPLSFLDHIIRRLGLKNHLHWMFMKRCEHLLLSLIADFKFLCYLPSILASATMLYIINQFELSNPMKYQNQLMGVLKINKEKVDECYQLILDSTLKNPTRKRKYESIPSSPNAIIDSSFSCDDSSNDSWTVTESILANQNPLLKKKNKRIQVHQLGLPPFNRVAVEVLTSPR